jgi:hypothetical protein
METINVPVSIASLSAAISARVAALTTETSPDDVWAILGLIRVLESAVDRLALADVEV